VRIIGGAWRRTPIPVADVAGLRPSPDRVRESLFNWLAHLRPDIGGLRGLDLFAGTGALGFEFASRGAARVVLIERFPVLGGVCLNVGCIPSKALLHAAEVINEAAELAHMGVRFGAPEIDLDALRAGKDRVVKRSTQSLAQLAKQRKVQVIHGAGRFDAPNRLSVQTATGTVLVEFEQCIVACGSSPVRIPGFPYEDERLIDSTGALALRDIPKRLLVIGGGIIGMEMATVYSALGSRVDVVELQDQLIPGCDADLVKALQKVIAKRYENIWLGTKVTAMSAGPAGIKVSLEGKGAPLR
jgi:dihydrolipoamide dehydrogenase